MFHKFTADTGEAIEINVRHISAMWQSVEQAEHVPPIITLLVQNGAGHDEWYVQGLLPNIKADLRGEW